MIVVVRNIVVGTVIVCIDVVVVVARTVVVIGRVTTCRMVVLGIVIM